MTSDTRNLIDNCVVEFAFYGICRQNNHDEYEN